MGELTAAMLADAISFEDGLILAREWALLMQSHSNQLDGCMAIAHLSADILEGLISDHSTDDWRRVWISTYNTWDSHSLSAERPVMESFIDHVKAVKPEAEIIMLPVSVASHCYIVEEAVPKYWEMLEQRIREPKIPILSGALWTDDKGVVEVTTKEDLITSLADGLIKPVRFWQCVEHCVKEGVDDFVEASARGSFIKLIKEIVYP